MERMPSFEYGYRRESPVERLLGLKERGFERELGISQVEVKQFWYLPESNKFSSVESRRQRSVEVLMHEETPILIVPPPTPGKITVEDLATMALPVVGFIKRQQPDIVIGCDRGARIYAVAVHSVWNKLRRGQRFPTLDAKIHFARLSTSLGVEIISLALADILVESVGQAKRWGREFNWERPRIMFIDDWISSGATRRHILQSLNEIGVLSGVDVSFAVMCGSGADAAGRKDRVNVPWHDNPEVIGVNYTQDGRPFPVCTKAAGEIRRRIHKATKLAANLG